MPRLSHETGDALHETWEFLAMICNTLLFILVGFAVDINHFLSRLDVILLTGSVPTLPEPFRNRLSIGGRLGAIVGRSPVMEAMVTNAMVSTPF